MVAFTGPLATRNCESRQVRKEATAAVDVCDGVGAVWAAAIFFISYLYGICENSKRFAVMGFLIYSIVKL
jgi:hypothetical protein